MASPTQWTWVWANSERWWRTGKPGVLQSMGSQRLGHWATEQEQWLLIWLDASLISCYLFSVCPILLVPFFSCSDFVWINLIFNGDFLSGSAIKNLLTVQERQETRLRPLGQEGLLEKHMATQSSTLAWRIPWAEEPGVPTVHGVAKSRIWLKPLSTAQFSMIPWFLCISFVGLLPVYLCFAL